MFEDAALELAIEFLLAEPRQLRADAGFGVGDEAGDVQPQKVARLR
jgi:hypothetical protein